ncbi:hypothetical protein HYC85_029774 [Camellia sinensis]|uniref:Uncharacterized protein n=1 Tax=Camellia sinensis TaxID=4442 RepID=A0A7J7FYU1_CAMSI|nr:hypothetical protein HYC85_029774 [Camellia sinensis]
MGQNREGRVVNGGGFENNNGRYARPLGLPQFAWPPSMDEDFDAANALNSENKYRFRARVESSGSQDLVVLSTDSVRVTKNIDDPRFLNKAVFITIEDQIKLDGSAANPWRLCSIQQVEEVKCVQRVLPKWAAGTVYSISLVQQETFIVFQALHSNRQLGNTGFLIPAISYNVFQMLSLTIWIPIYNRLIVPMLQKLTKKDDGITIL